MTSTEIARAYHESVVEPDHWAELLEAIAEHADIDQVVAELNRVYKREGNAS